MKPEEPKQSQLTDAEILTADITTLTLEQMQRRIAINAVRKSEMELEVVENQAQKFQEDKSERTRQAQMKSQIIEEEAEKLRREKSLCAHKSGGKGLQGWFAGDGRHGYTVALQMLPTGEQYLLCFRCQKEWRLPKKRDVLSGKMSLKEYRQQEHEFHTAMSWDRQMFITDTGAVPASCQFRIPKLEAQRLVDDQEFELYLEKNSGKVAHAG